MILRNKWLVVSLFSILGLTQFTDTAQARALQCGDIAQLMEVFLRNHYSEHSLSDTIRTRTVDQFIKFLDPSKTSLLEGDVAILKKQLANVFSELERGNCTGIDQAHQLLVKRMEENKAYVDGLLGASYKFDENVDLILNPDLRGYAKTSAERNVYLGKMLNFQISNYLLTDTKLDEAKRLIKKRNELSLKRASDRKTNEVYDLYTEAFAHSLDPHSSYMSQDALEDFQIQMQLSLEGIGASLSSEDGYTVIEELIPGGAADKAKELRPKDKIIAVAQDGKPPVTVIDMDLRDVVKLIRGKKGTKVHLNILRQGDGAESFKVSLVRDKVDLKEQAAKITYETKKVEGKNYKIGVIDLPSFYGGGKGEGRSCYQDVKSLLKQATDNKVDGIVLDLSRNGGGLLDQAVQIGGLFIKKGGIVATKSSDGRVEVLADQDSEINYSGPVVVVTSHLSASASEILAGALKAYNRAVIVGGDHSFGKGTVQVLAPLPDHLGAMKVTTGMFFVPNGYSTQHLGVASDIMVPSVFNSDEVGEKKLDYSLAQQKIDAFVSTEANVEVGAAQNWKAIDAQTIKKLSEKTALRVNKSAKFAQIRKDLDEASKAHGVIHLAELRKKASLDKKSGKRDKKKAHKPAPEDDDGFPVVQESQNILVDLIDSQNMNVQRQARF